MATVIASVTEELDDIATTLEKHGQTKLAYALDEISNTLNDYDTKTASDHNSAPAGAPAGAEDTVQKTDVYEAPSIEPKVKGDRSVSQSLGQEPESLLKQMDWAQAMGGEEKHKIISYSKKMVEAAKKGDWQQLSNLATKAAMNIKTAADGESNDFSTASLDEMSPESENDFKDPEWPSTLPATFSEFPAGQGPDPGHISASRKAGKILRDRKGKKTAKPAAKTASVEVFRPTHVPEALLPVWKSVAEHASGTGKLLTASGEVDYQHLNRQYRRLLASYSKHAYQASDD